MCTGITGPLKGISLFGKVSKLMYLMFVQFWKTALSVSYMFSSAGPLAVARAY